MSNRFLYDSQTLSLLVSEHIYKQGLVYLNQERVIAAYLEDDKLLAQVEGSDSDLPYDLELSFTDDQLTSECDCHHTDICKHAVAALLSYANELNHQDTFGSAMDEAINERIKKGRTEVRVKHVDGHPIFGNWQAASIVSTTHWQQTYQIQIRSLSQRINYCSCPDHATNQLGTCKHIEATLYAIEKLPESNQQLPPTPFLYTDFNANPALRLQRTAQMAQPLQALLDYYFDADGRFTGQLPDDFLLLRDQLYGNEEITIGPDVHLWLSALIVNQGHKLKAQEISTRIKQANGRMPNVKATLYPYQIDGVAFLAGNGRALLADDMGLGKTLQAISATTWLMQHAKVQRTLIICPASLKHQWAREIDKFTGMQTQIIQGNAEKRGAQYRQDKPFFIVNYELILRDLSIIHEVLTPDLIILDEAQRIKNWRTKIASSVKLIRSDYAFVLTGTPLENRLQDLYSLMQMVDPKVLGPLWRYMSDFHVCDDKGKVLGYRNLGALRQRLKPVMLRRNRSIVSDQLPERIDTQLDIAMTPKQCELHDVALSAAGQLSQIAKRRPLTPSEQNRMMAALQQARMACDAAGLVDKETQGSPKLKELKNLLDEFCLQAGRKVVLFSQWKGMTDMVEALVRSMSLGYVHLHGGVPTHKRGDLMARFLEDDSTYVFISTDAGGTGLNLQSGSVVINLDVPWNPAVLEQRNARVHRLGQTNNVHIILMVAEDSYEQRVLELVNNKQFLFDNVISENATEDTVGLSKQSIATVINELNNDKELSIEPSAKAIGPVQAVGAIEAISQSVKDNQAISEIDMGVNHLVERLQQAFGFNIAQIMVKDQGLLVILEQLTDHAESLVEQWESDIPIALIDVKTLRSLQRLGDSSPLNDAKPLPLIQTNLWQTRAQQQLKAAQALIDLSLDVGVIELLCLAACAFLTGKANRQQAMPVEEASVWIYNQGQQTVITSEQTMTLAKIFNLRWASTIPSALLHQSFSELEQMINS